MKKILVRAASGSIYVALIVAALLLQSPYLFYGLFAIFTVLGIIELHHLVDNNSRHKLLVIILDCFGGVMLFSAFFLHGQKYPSPHAVSLYELFTALCITYIVARIILQIYIKADNALQSFAHSCLAQIYVALPLAMLNTIYFCSSKLLLAIFIMIWLNDTGAFCVGSLLGRHRLFERISPKKSWEGFWGGLAFSAIAGFLLYYFDEELFGPHMLLPLEAFIVLGIIVPVFATWGDLAESLLKRTVHVKDSGHLIPGHGGILDRIDSLLLVSPVIVAFLLMLDIMIKI